MLRSIGLQRVRRNLATEKQQHVYMESKQMVLINLFSGQEWRLRRKEPTCGHEAEGKGRVGQIERVALTYRHSCM